jgi:hypothetical protein
MRSFCAILYYLIGYKVVSNYIIHFCFILAYIQHNGDVSLENYTGTKIYTYILFRLGFTLFTGHEGP